MLRYHVRSRDLISMVTEIREGKLVLSPYFQRNLVWREVHRRDFIETILLGLPFPQVFIAQGDIDVENMTSTSCVVDGQQRLNSIMEYINGELLVNGKLFENLGDVEKQEFLRYQVPVIDLELKVTDPTIVDVFQRLNRTFYALSSIEKLSTEYGTIDLMLIAKHACNLLAFLDDEDEIDDNIKVHPYFPEGFNDWSAAYEVDNFRRWISNERIFSPFELARMVNLQYALNIFATLSAGFFARNDQTKKFLESKVEFFPVRDELLETVDRAAEFILNLALEDNSVWWNKANAFTLFIIVHWHFDKCLAMGDSFKEKLLEFQINMPAEYQLAAREGVNNRKERIERHEILCDFLELKTDEKPLIKDENLFS